MITYAEVLEEVTHRSGRGDAVEDVVQQLGAILHDLSTIWPFLETSADVTIVQASDPRAIALPDDFRSLIAVVNTSLAPLRSIPSWNAYLQRINASDTAGTPTRYILYDEKIWVYPKASVDTTLTLYYAQYCHFDATDDTIPFGEQFREAIYTGTTWKVLEAVDQGASLAVPHKEAYAHEVEKLVNRYKRMRHPAELIQHPAAN